MFVLFVGLETGNFCGLDFENGNLLKINFVVSEWDGGGIGILIQVPSVPCYR
jgi:hypothetical protein